MTALFYDAVTDDQLPTATTPSAADLLTLFQNGNNAKISYTALAQAILAELLASVPLGVNTTLSRASHHNRILFGTSALTLTAPSAATLGNGFTARFINKPTSGTVTLAGMTSLSGTTTVAPGAAVTIECDGTAVYVSGSGSVASAAPGVTGTPTVTTIGDTSIGLTWTAPTTGGIATGYKVYQSATNSGTAPGSGWTLAAGGTPATNSATITGLTVSTTYYFQIIPTNGVDGPASATGTATTQATLAAPNAPGAFAMTTSTATTATFTWTESGGTPTTRQLQYRAGGTSGAFSNVPGQSVAGGSGTATGLTPSTAFDFQLVLSNGTGSATSSILTNKSTTVAAPGPITGFSASNITRNGATLAWTNSAGATAWKVSTRTPAGGNGAFQQVTTFATVPGATGAVLNTLATGQTYDVQVVASNAGGDSAAVTLSPSILTLPGAVTNLTASNITATGLTLNWTNATGATGWTVEFSTAHADTWQTIAATETATGAPLTGLSSGTYDFRVTASNATGTSPVSAELDGVTVGGTTAATMSGSAPIFWLDASKTGNLFADSARTTAASSGGPVMGIADASSSGINFSAASSGAAPTLLLNAANGLPGLAFNNSNSQFLSAAAGTALTNFLAAMKSNTGNWSVLVVLKSADARNNNFSVAAIGNSAQFGQQYGNMSINYISGGPSNVVSSIGYRFTSNGGASVQNNDPTNNHFNSIYKVLYTFNASTGTMSAQSVSAGGTVINTAGSTTNAGVTGTQLAAGATWDSFWIGHGSPTSFANMTLHEMVIWPNVPGTGEAASVLNAATSKWGS